MVFHLCNDKCISKYKAYTCRYKVSLLLHYVSSQLQKFLLSENCIYSSHFFNDLGSIQLFSSTAQSFHVPSQPIAYLPIICWVDTRQWQISLPKAKNRKCCYWVLNPNPLMEVENWVLYWLLRYKKWRIDAISSNGFYLYRTDSATRFIAQRTWTPGISPMVPSYVDKYE